MTAAELFPSKVVVVPTVRASEGAISVPDETQLTESELEAPTAEPEMLPPMPVVIVGVEMLPFNRIKPVVLVAVLLIDVTFQLPFGAVWAMDEDAEIIADETSNAKRAFLLIMTSVSLHL